MSAESQIKAKMIKRLRARKGDAYVRAHAKFIEEQWQYLKSIGMLDPETDIVRPTESR